MRSRARLLAVPAALAGALALAGCSEQVDLDQARICRSLLPPLHRPGARFEILRTSSGPENGSVRIVFRVHEAGGPARIRFVQCRFGGTGMSRARQDLVEVVTDSGRLSETSLFFLKRFYLGSGESALEDPGETGGGAEVPEVSPGLAYAVQQAVSGLPQATVYGLLAAAYSLVYGLVGRIVFGFGELAGVGGYAALLGIAGVLAGAASTGTAALLALPLAIGAAALHGAAAGRLVGAGHHHRDATRVGALDHRPQLRRLGRRHQHRPHARDGAHGLGQLRGVDPRRLPSVGDSRERGDDLVVAVRQNDRVAHRRVPSAVTWQPAASRGCAAPSRQASGGRRVSPRSRRLRAGVPPACPPSRRARSP